MASYINEELPNLNTTKYDPFTAWLSTVIPAIVFIVTIVYLYYEHKFRAIKSFFKLDGPKPWPVIGNLLRFFTCPQAKIHIEGMKKYGKMFIFFMCTTPRIIIGDREVVQRICTKDFDSFMNHDAPKNIVRGFAKYFLFFLQGNHWKKVRALMSPTFTSSKIKRMFKLIDVCADDLVDCIDEQIDVEIEKQSETNQPQTIGQKTRIKSKEIYSLYTLDAIASCCYALKLIRQKGSFSLDSTVGRNGLARQLLELFQFDRFRFAIIFLLPDFLGKYIYQSKGEQAMTKVASYVRGILEERQKKPVKYDDYLEILTEAKIDDKMDLNENDQHENFHAGLTESSLKADQDKISKDVISVSSKVELTEIEILANAIFLLMVGLETTASLLRNLSYCLAFHPHVQDKLYSELVKIAKFDEKTKRYSFDYDHLTACSYLDAVICENLRYMSPISTIDRVSLDDYLIEKYNVLIPKGTVIMLSYCSIHMDPANWPEPDKFDPERFSPENRDKILPGSYTPFGQGPRHCIGMRFSLTETKVALAKIIMNYRFSPVPGDPWPPVLAPSSGLVKYQHSDVMVERR